MRTRAAIVLPCFGNGGAENMVSRLASNLDLSRIDAQVLCICGEPLRSRLENDVTNHGVPIKFIGKGRGFSLPAARRLWRELSEFKPAVVHTHLSACVYCAPWVLRHRAAMLHTVHSMPQYELIWPKQKLMAFMYRTGRAVPVAVSGEIRRLTALHYRLKRGPELVYNPVDFAKFALARRAHREFRIVTAGRLSAPKNQRLLIDAVKLLSEEYPDLRLTILGDGPLREELEAYIQQEGLRDKVQLAGNVDNAEEYFAGSDLFVLSSVYEGLPLAVLEAMAAGLPIVSTDVGGVRDIVTGNGFLVPSENTGALVRAMKVLIQDHALREAMGANSRRNVMCFDSPVIAEQYAGLYEKYAAERRRCDGGSMERAGKEG